MTDLRPVLPADASPLPVAERSWWPRAALGDRLAQTGIAAGAWIVLILAFHLHPSPEGLGTHQQLGFEPCAFYQMTGRPCPGCGLTTAFAHMAHGQVVQAAIVQPFGAVLFVLTLAAALGTTVTAIRGRSWNLVLMRHVTPAWLFVLAGLGFGGWIFKIVYGQVTGGYRP
jgi:hypothetical protein